MDTTSHNDIGKLNCMTLSCGPDEDGCSCIWTCSDQQTYLVDCVGQDQTYECQCRVGDAGTGQCTTLAGANEACTVNRCCDFPF